jgi:hypothetical protein
VGGSVAEHKRDDVGREAIRWLAVLIVVASALHFLGGRAADPDLWGHLKYGEQILAQGRVPKVDVFSYTAPGQPFYDHEWLSDAAFAALYRVAGAPGLIGLKVALCTLMLLAMLDAARTIGREIGGLGSLHPLTVAAVLVLALAVIEPGATFRPQLFTMAFLAVEGALLSRADRRLRGSAARAVGWELCVLPPLLLLWANLHGGFVVGVGLLALFAAVIAQRAVIGSAGSARDARLDRRALGTAGAVASLALLGALAPLVNPYGLELFSYLGRTLGMHDEITEWYPVPLLSTEFLRFKLMVLATAGGCALLWSMRREQTVVARLLDWRAPFLALAALYALRHQRHTVLFAIAAAPLLVVAAEQARLRLLERWPSLRPSREVFASAAAGAALVAAFQLYGVAADVREHGAAIRFGRLDYPADAVEFLRTHGFSGNVAMPFEWGAYAIWKLAPDSRVFIDGRFEAIYPPRVIDDYFAFMHGTDGWEKLLDDYPTDVVVVQRWRNIHPRLFKRPDLTYVYSDPAAFVFVRRTPTTSEALARLALVADRHDYPPPETVFP